jgi:fluoroacetyl-CoA thioesterase
LTVISLMEIAAARILTPILGPGQMSVGVSVDVSHGAPTPLGRKVVAEAKYLGRTGAKGKDGEGKLFEFEVMAKDEGGEIGRGRHVRAVVDARRLEAAAVKRKGVKGESCE